MIMKTNKLLRFGRRQLQTIASRDIIKPSSPTPSHLKTYNLSLLDRIAMNAYIPIVMFYQNLAHDRKPLELKNSLSRTLSHYYPFAGRLVKSSPTYVNCNDEGVEFIEAYNDCRLSDFLKHSHHEDLDQLFPHNLIWYNSNHNDGYDEKNKASTSPLTIQVSHFAFGGIVIATSLFHKIVDACSMLNFFNHWATMTHSQKDASHINPHFISHQTRNISLSKDLSHRKNRGDYVTRSLLFPNTKINRLIRKVESMAMEARTPIKNLTRVEVLMWLLHTRLVAAASSKSKTFKATGVCHIMNMRNTLVETLPMTTVGNLCLRMDFLTRDQSDLAPDAFIWELRKTKMEFQRISSLETAIEMVAGTCSEAAILEKLNKLNEYYILIVLSWLDQKQVNIKDLTTYN